MRRTRYLFVLLILALFATPASAAQPLTTWGQYWTGFAKFWGTVFSSFGGIAGLVLGTGALGLFIITRGKWLK